MNYFLTIVINYSTGGCRGKLFFSSWQGNSLPDGAEIFGIFPVIIQADNYF